MWSSVRGWGMGWITISRAGSRKAWMVYRRPADLQPAKMANLIIVHELEGVGSSAPTRAPLAHVQRGLRNADVPRRHAHLLERLV